MILGTTASSVGAEGVAPSADWSVWERSGRAPRSGDGNGFATNHADDMALLAAMGITAHRMTVEWARIEPRAGIIDNDAVDNYLDILRSAARAGVSVWLTLAHTSLPGWFADDERGFADQHAREFFWARHVDRCATLFGDQVAGWVPIEDPIGWAVRGYGLATRPPGVRDPVRLAAAIEGALLANLTAWRQLSSGEPPVMAVHGTPTLFPSDPDAHETCDEWRHRFWDSWIRLYDEGVLAVEDRAPLRIEEAVEAFDLIGLSFDGPLAVTSTGSIGPYPADARRCDNGIAPNPEELGVALRTVHERIPDRRLAVAATGFGTDDDDWRDDLLDASLQQTLAAVDDDVPIEAFFYDTAIDGYEWMMGFESHRGLIDRDRHKKPSIERMTGSES
jgi:beta-glucosidase